MMKKQWIGKVIGFSSLSLSLVSGLASAQQQLPSQLVSNQGTANMVEGNVNTVAATELRAQPVAVTSGMAPSVAPVAETSSGLSVGSSGVSLSSAPTTGIGGANTGNANTGGLQVQNVTVQANPEAKATNMSSMNADYARAELLRQRRVRSEVENETRLLEKLEEGRLSDERVRQGNIETYYSNVAGSATATAVAGGGIGGGAVATATAVETVPVTTTAVSAEEVAGAAFLGMSTFSLTPFAGYRWFDNSSNYSRAVNYGTFGLSLEGKFNRYLSFEGAFTYGRDRLYERYGYGYNQMYSELAGMVNSRDTFEVTGGLKLGFQASRKIRPYIAGALGGMYSQYNIDNPMVLQEFEVAGLKRATTSFIGNAGTGIDFTLTRNINLGTRFDYQGVFSNHNTSMDAIWGDRDARYRLTGSLQIVF